MKGFALIKVAGLILAAVLLASCYAPIANQNGYLNLSLQFEGGAKAATNEVIGLVVNADYENTFRETLNLIDKGKHATLTSANKDRLTELAKQLATSGLVKFGGFPFFDTKIDPSGGSFDLTGLPAGRSYFVKLFVFKTGISFKVENIDENFWNLIQSTNLVFPPELWANDLSWQGWGAGQKVDVVAGKTTTLHLLLGAVP
jgi:hypothetical protein